MNRPKTSKARKGIKTHEPAKRPSGCYSSPKTSKARKGIKTRLAHLR